MTRRALLQGILDSPEDNVVRLVFSDWLDENGESARAEFIRAQIELTATAEDDPSYEGLRQLVDRLLFAHRKEWVKGVPGWARHQVKFSRGFVEEVVCTAASFANRGNRLFENAPVRGVRLTKYAGLIGQVTARPHSRLVSSVTLIADRHEGRLTSEDVRAIGESAWSANLEILDLSCNWLGQPEIEILTRADFPRLHTLILNQNYLRQGGLQILLDWPSLRHVRRLGLHHNVFRTHGMGPINEMLRLSPNLEGLRELDISDSIDPSDLLALTDTPGLAGLQILNLAYNRLDNDACDCLARSTCLTRLESLDLAGNLVTEAGVEALIRSPMLHSPCRIGLERNLIEASSRASLRPRLIERFGPRVYL
jgi:uncharacterized protein (TIGR02996 family)